MKKFLAVVSILVTLAGFIGLTVFDFFDPDSFIRKELSKRIPALSTCSNDQDRFIAGVFHSKNDPDTFPYEKIIIKAENNKCKYILKNKKHIFWIENNNFGFTIDTPKCTANEEVMFYTNEKELADKNNFATRNICDKRITTNLP